MPLFYDISLHLQRQVITISYGYVTPKSEKPGLVRRARRHAIMKCIFNAYGEFNKTRQVGPATWPHFDLLFIHDGHVRIQFSHKKQIELVPGQSVLIYPDTHFAGRSLCEVSRASAHHFEFDDESDLLSRRFKGKCHGWQEFTSPRTAHIESDLDRLIKLADQNHGPLLFQTRSLLMSLVLTQLLHGQDGPEAIETRWVDLQQWLKKHLSEPPSMETMARRLGLSTSHFQAAFRRQFHISPGRYLLEMRLEEAARLLRETVMPIKQVAHRVGYAHVQHFHRAFRNHYEQTPTQYREKFSPQM